MPEAETKQKQDAKPVVPAGAMKLHPLFKLPSPQRKKAEDGSGQMVEVDFRIGNEVASYTAQELIEKIGLYKEYEREIRSIKAPKNLVLRDRMRRKSYNSFVSRVKGYTRSLVKWYNTRMESQNAGVIGVWLPSHAGSKEDVFYIQAVYSLERGTIMLGEADETTMAIWKTMRLTQNGHIKYVETRRIAKAMHDQQGIEKDIRHQLKLLIDGEIPNKIPKIGFEEQK